MRLDFIDQMRGPKDANPILRGKAPHMAQDTGADGGFGGATTVGPKRAERRTGKKVPLVPGGKGRARAEGTAGKRRKQATAAPGSHGSKKK